MIRQKTSEYGAVFILDEVKTGFRIANGGAQEYYNLKPDLATYAKALGNGYPVAALGGKKEIMSIIGHGVSQGGTYTNNKPGIAGAWATLKVMQREPVIETINQRGTRLMNGLKDILDENGLQSVITGYPGMFTFSLGVDSLACQRDWSESDKALYLRLAEAAMEHGVMPDYDAREPWFLCYSHSEADIDKTLEVYAEVVKTVK
jgi:glutamate-1-semialdehyde 2,1-aminomutase